MNETLLSDTYSYGYGLKRPMNREQKMKKNKKKQTIVSDILQFQLSERCATVYRGSQMLQTGSGNGAQWRQVFAFSKTRLIYYFYAE